MHLCKGFQFFFAELRVDSKLLTFLGCASSTSRFKSVDLLGMCLDFFKSSFKHLNFYSSLSAPWHEASFSCCLPLMTASDKNVKDVRKLYMYCVYRDFLLYFVVFLSKLGTFRTGWTPIDVVQPDTVRFLGLTFRKWDFKWEWRE